MPRFRAADGLPMSTALKIASTTEALAPLYDTGQRRFRRLTPTAERPGKLTMTTATGWAMSERAIGDISLGGLSLRLRFWEGRKVSVGDEVSVIVDLAGRRHALKAKAVHLSRLRQGWTADWKVGLEFREDRAYQLLWPGLCSYLLALT